MTSTIAQLEASLESSRATLTELLALRRELQSPFRLHPLGFLACTLLTEGPLKLRLHFWPVGEGVQQSIDCQVHDHVFSFKSWVLSGAVVNVEYHSATCGEEFAVYRATYEEGQSVLTKTESRLRLRERKRSIHNAGSSYSVSAGVLHETRRLGLTSAFTVLVASDVSEASPLVVGPLDGANQYRYRRDVLPDEVVEAMLAEIEGSNDLPKVASR